MHRQSIVYVDRASFVFLILMHPDVCTASVFFFFSSLPCAYCKTKHQLGGYLALYVDGKRTPTILFVELSSRARSNSALARNERYSFVLCIGKKRTRRKKIWDNTKKWERKERGRERKRRGEERRRYMYIYKPSALLILVRRAQKATRQICVASPFVCVLKSFYSGK